MSDATTIVALDVGERRIGIASASRSTHLASPLTTVINDDAIFDNLKNTFTEQHASALVIGLPRSLSGDHTQQTEAVESFVLQLRQHVDLPIYWQDEALTSRQAEDELNGRGKPYKKEDIDALAACYILSDFLKDHFHGSDAV
jgi:putative Holliday junction resolvase